MVFESQIISPVPSPPSALVNIMAWILAIFGGGAACVAILKNVMLFLPKKELAEAMQQSGQEIPMLAKIMSHSEFFFALIFSVALLFVGISLLKRKNWARIVTIIMITLGILLNIAFLVVLFTLLPEMINVSRGEPIAEIRVINFMQVFFAILAVAFLALQIFVIKNLCSQKIRKEFQ